MKKPKLVIAFSLLFFFVCVSLKLHGFSTPIWHDLIDGSERTEIIWGNAQGIRTDDWAASLPTIIAQANHVPSFPSYNENIGNGERLAAVNPQPAGWVSIFRPQVIGFLADVDFGLAWMWWFQIIGLFLAVYLFASTQIENSSAPFWIALATVFTPLLVFFSYNAAALMAHLFACLALVGARPQKNRLLTVTKGLALGYFASCFFMCLYPPYQISAGYVAGFYLLAILWGRAREKSELYDSLIVVGTGTLILGMMAFIWAWQNSEVIHALMHTDYPGQRVETGGRLPFYWLLRSNLLFPYLHKITDWGPFGNLSEQGGAIFVFPFLALGMLWHDVRQRAMTMQWWVVLIPTCLLAFYICFSIPEGLAKASLFSMVPPGRCLFGLTFANILLLIVYFAHPCQPDWGKGKSRFALLIFFIAILCVYFGIGAHIRSMLSKVHWEHVLIAVMANGLIAFYILRKRVFGLVILTATSFFCTWWFNPLVRGGMEDLLAKPLLQKARALDETHGKESLWVSFGDGFQSNLLRMVNIHDIAGVHYYPDFDFWALFDKSGKHRKKYNRYAHVFFSPVNKKPEALTFLSHAADQVKIQIDPRNPVFEKLGVDYFLVPEQNTQVFSEQGFQEIYRDSHYVIYSATEFRS